MRYLWVGWIVTTYWTQRIKSLWCRKRGWIVCWIICLDYSLPKVFSAIIIGLFYWFTAATPPMTAQFKTLSCLATFLWFALCATTPPSSPRFLLALSTTWPPSFRLVVFTTRRSTSFISSFIVRRTCWSAVLSLHFTMHDAILNASAQFCFHFASPVISMLSWTCFLRPLFLCASAETRCFKARIRTFLCSTRLDIHQKISYRTQ